MESREARVCQCHCVPQLSEGTIQVRPPSFKSWLKLTLKRSLGGSTKRKLKMHSARLAQSIGKLAGKSDALPVVETVSQRVSLVAGDLVRVRSEEEIRATLNAWNELKGCMLMDAQQQYCGTTQRVLKPVERFVDERDYRVKRAKGLILLEGLICEGTPDYGRCDRACFYFWREEWLEKIE
jgi:hypothetical protein